MEVHDARLPQRYAYRTTV